MAFCRVQSFAHRAPARSSLAREAADSRLEPFCRIRTGTPAGVLHPRAAGVSYTRRGDKYLSFQIAPSGRERRVARY
jgi:hypothetical protein